LKFGLSRQVYNKKPARQKSSPGDMNELCGDRRQRRALPIVFTRWYGHRRQAIKLNVDSGRNNDHCSAKNLLRDHSNSAKMRRESNRMRLPDVDHL
jgi:hypothetical protein